MTTSLGQPDAIAISGFLIFIALSLGHHLVGRAQDAQRRSVLHGGADDLRAARTGSPWRATT